MSPFDANTADAGQIAQWLEIALDGYIEDDMGRWAFRPLERYIGLRDDLVDDLCAIYDSLEASAKSRWRRAIRDLLAIHGSDISKRKATRILIDFAVLARSSEVLEVLPGILSGSQDEEMLDIAVEAATALASQTDASRRCLERIRTSPAFTSHYAGLVLVALCHADPDNWLHHVEDLAVPMGKLASELSQESTALRFYASNILDAIGLSRITNVSLNNLAADSAWLTNEWLEGNDSLLGVYPDATSARLVLRANDSVSAELEGPLDRTVLATHGLQTSQRTAIAWEREGNERTWVAVCSDMLTELTVVEPSRQSLLAFISNHLGEVSVVHWRKRQIPKYGGIVFASADGSLSVASGGDLRALRAEKLANRRTDRVGYLLPHRQRVEPALRRRAYNDPRAFNATAAALALAPAPA